MTEPTPMHCGSLAPHEPHRFDEDRSEDGRLSSWRFCPGLVDPIARASRVDELPHERHGD